MAYFTVAEFRERFPDVTEAQYPDSQVDTVRATAEEAFEDVCGVAFEPRTRTDVVSGDGTDLVLLPVAQVRSVTAATIAGAAVDVSGLSTAPWGAVYSAGRWARGFQNVSVTYAYGLDAPPLRVKQAVMLLTRVWLVEGPVDKRATQIGTEFGGTINLATPGMLGATFGIPEVDATVEQYKRTAYVA